MAITIESFLAALRTQESHGNYKDTSTTSTASGAYGYLDSTWAGYHGFSRAWLAPPVVQDAKATQDVTAKLQAYGGDWAKVAASWFAGPGWVAAHPNPSSWNVNPAPGTNNPTVTAYVTGVLKAADTSKSSSSGGVLGTITSLPGDLYGGAKGLLDAPVNAISGAFSGWANDLYKLLVTVTLLGGGVALIGVGMVRLAGSSKTVQTVEQAAPLAAVA